MHAAKKEEKRPFTFQLALLHTPPRQNAGGAGSRANNGAIKHAQRTIQKLKQQGESEYSSHIPPKEKTRSFPIWVSD
jgi:hypothetical protein